MTTKRAILALCCAALSSCGHFEDVTAQGSLRGEAGRNPLLAAELMLTQMGLVATSVKGLPFSIPEDTVMLLSGEALRSPNPLLDRFLVWVAEGHHALVFLDGFDDLPPISGGARDADSALLDRLSVTRVPHRFLDVPEQASPLPEEFDAPIFDLDLREEAGALRLADGSYHRVVEVGYGSGAITLIPEGSIIARKNLAHGDRAAWLWETVHGELIPPRKTVLLVHGGRTGLGSLILRYVPMAPWTLAVLVLIGLWRMAVRFGPIRASAPDPQLGFEGHVEAVGRFLWKQGDQPDLANAWRQRVARAAQAELRFPTEPHHDVLRRPGFIEAIAERSNMPHNRVHHALTSDHVDQPDSFLTVIADLQQIERSL